MGGGNRSGWAQFIRADELAEPHVTRALLPRVARYARPYVAKIALVPFLVLLF